MALRGEDQAPPVEALDLDSERDHDLLSAGLDLPLVGASGPSRSFHKCAIPFLFATLKDLQRVEPDHELLGGENDLVEDLADPVVLNFDGLLGKLWEGEGRQVVKDQGADEIVHVARVHGLYRAGSVPMLDRFLAHIVANEPFAPRLMLTVDRAGAHREVVPGAKLPF